MRGRIARGRRRDATGKLRNARARAVRTPHRRGPSHDRGSPLEFGRTVPLVRDPRHDEQQIGQAVQVHDDLGLDVPAPRPTTARSARRQMVRATCNDAPAGFPPARINAAAPALPTRGGRSVLQPLTTSPAIAVFATRGGILRRDRPMRTDREQIPLDAREHVGEPDHCRSHGRRARHPVWRLAVGLDSRVGFAPRTPLGRRFHRCRRSGVDFHGVSDEKLYEMAVKTRARRAGGAGKAFCAGVFHFFFRCHPNRRRFRQRLLDLVYGPHGRECPMEKDRRSVPYPGLRDHASADAGRPCAAQVREIVKSTRRSTPWPRPRRPR